jgi:hypothetical protein
LSVVFRKKIEDEDNGDPLQTISDPKFTRETAMVGLREAHRRRRAYFSMCVHAVFIKYDESGDIADKITYVTSTNRVSINFGQSLQNMQEVVGLKIKDIDNRLQDFTAQGSGWSLSEILFVDLTFTTLGGIRGGCPGFKYPRTKGMLNIQSDDQKCLLYCVIAAFHASAIPAKLRNKHTSYLPFIESMGFNLEGVSFPMDYQDLALFEEKNKHLHFFINVFVSDGQGEIIPVRQILSGDGDSAPGLPHIQKTINVLLEKAVDGDKPLFHYMLIDRPSKFLSKTYFSKVNKGKRGYSATQNCERCFAAFRSLGKLRHHQKQCQDFKHTRLTFPEAGKKIKFEQPWKRFPQLVAGFVDFESILVKSEGDDFEIFLSDLFL